MKKVERGSGESAAPPKPRRNKVEFQERYVGKLSRDFWRRVNRIPWSEDGQAIYVLGCALQDLESRVVTMLNNAEKKNGRERGDN